MRDASAVEQPSWSAGDVLAPLVRRRRTCLALFVGALTVAGVAAWLAPPEYASEMTLVVRRDRIDPVVTPDPGAPSSQTEVSESELLSEAEILRSRDLLEQVVLDAGLHQPSRYHDAGEEARARGRAIARLGRALSIAPIRRTTLIRVRYAAEDPVTAHRVLARLADRYLDKHLAVHRVAGTQEFFGEQVGRSRQALTEAQERLAAFGRREQVVAPEQERITVVQQLAGFETALQQARAEAADAERRLAAVTRELAVTPARQVTAIRTANSGVVGQLKGRILEMELERDVMLRKFTPSYPPIVQLDAQLQHARVALADAERVPILDETTDQNPTAQWLRNEGARIRAERAALAARVGSLSRSILEYRERARRLDTQVVEQQDLLRSVAAADEAFRLYARKEEEARIADALDRTRIANVGVLDPPALPTSESGDTRALILLLGLVAASIVSVGGAYVLDWLRPVVYSPRDVQDVLNVPVLAMIPARAD